MKQASVGKNGLVRSRRLSDSPRATSREVHMCLSPGPLKITGHSQVQAFKRTKSHVSSRKQGLKHRMVIVVLVQIIYRNNGIFGLKKN